MTEYDILGVLNNQLVQFSQEHPIDIAFPGVSYDPTVGTPYIKPNLIPATNSSVGIGIDTKNRHIGVYQITVRIPSAQTLGDMKVILSVLKKYFKKSSSLILDDVKVRITRFLMGPFVEEPDWYTQIVRVEYRADLEN